MTVDMSKYKVLGNVRDLQHEEAQFDQPNSLQAEPQTAAPVDLSKYTVIGNVNDQAKKEERLSFIPPTPEREPWSAKGLAAQTLGLAKAKTWPADIYHAWATAEGLQGLEELKEKGLPVDEGKYMQALEAATSIIPTQENIERGVENLTGMQLRPKTEGEENLRETMELLGFLRKPITELYQPSRATKTPKLPEAVTNVIGEVPPSMYQETEEALKGIKQPVKPGPFQQIRVHPRRPTLAGRNVTRAPERNIGIAVPENAPATTGEMRIRQRYPYRVTSPVEAGEAATRLIRESKNNAYEEVSNLYDMSSELMSGVEAERPELFNNLLRIVREHAEYGNIDPVRGAIAQDARNIARDLVLRNAEGEIVGFRPMSQQQLIDRMQSIRRNIDINFQRGEYSNLYVPLIDALEDDITRLAATGSQEALQVWNNARATRRAWGETYQNKYVDPFADTRNHDYVKNIKRLENVDDYRQLQHILDETAEGRQILQGIRSEMLDKKTSKYMRGTHNRNDIVRDLRELQPVFSEQEINQIADDLTGRGIAATRSVRREGARPVEAIEAEKLPRTPEDIERLMKTRSGIKRVKELLDTPAFNKQRNAQMRRILYGGKTEGSLTGKELQDILLKEKNKELILELADQETYDMLLGLAKDTAAKDVTKERLMQFMKKSGTAAKFGWIGLLL